MRLFIPELGTRLTLLENWTFNVTNERRNADLAKLMGIDHKIPDTDYPRYPFGSIRYGDPIRFTSVHYDGEKRTERPGVQYGRRPKPITLRHTLAAGTILKVDRIYIRKGASDFSSVTFRIQGGKTQPRFFAKLADVNQMQVHVEE